MSNQEKLAELKQKVADKEALAESIKVEYDNLNKVKTLTDTQRIARIEKMLGIIA